MEHNSHRFMDNFGSNYMVKTLQLFKFLFSQLVLENSYLHHCVKRDYLQFSIVRMPHFILHLEQRCFKQLALLLNVQHFTNGFLDWTGQDNLSRLFNYRLWDGMEECQGVRCSQKIYCKRSFTNLANNSTYQFKFPKNLE